MGSEAEDASGGVSGGLPDDGWLLDSVLDEDGWEPLSEEEGEDDGVVLLGLSDDQAWETAKPIPNATTSAAIDRSTRPDLRLLKPLMAHFPNQRNDAAKPRQIALSPLRIFFIADQHTTPVSGGSAGALMG